MLGIVLIRELNNGGLLNDGVSDMKRACSYVRAAPNGEGSVANKLEAVLSCT